MWAYVGLCGPTFATLMTYQVSIMALYHISSIVDQSSESTNNQQEEKERVGVNSAKLVGS